VALFDAYDIIESHGGNISVKSEKGKGTQTKFIVPIFNEGERADDV
jgi:signal transduction histidine kinase